MRSTNNYTFSQVPRAEIPRSNFRRSHGHKTTFDEMLLVPVYLDEVLPGDTFNVKAQMFARLSTPIVPYMDNMFMDVFYFFVPNRLIWSNWQKFCGEQEHPGDSTVFLVPQVTVPVGGYAVGSIFDYMGLPTDVADSAAHALRPSAFWLRAYNLIYNEWFRDENLCSPALVKKDDGPDSYAEYRLLKRGKRHDYFTSCLPWPQKGAGVNLPLGTSAPVVPNPVNSWPFFIADTGTPGPYNMVTNGSGSLDLSGSSGAAAGIKWSDGANHTGLVADLTNATAATINSLRQAFQIQKLMERDARGGTRYREILLSHFGVVSPDARLQRPEFLGGGTVPVNVTPIAQTSATALTGSTTPIGKLAGVGTASGHTGFTKSFVEHGVILGLVSVRADLTYQQGLPRMFSRRTRYDFYWPALAHIGEQAVLNKEIYAQGSDDPVTGDNAVFGYQERWAEYRYYPSKITGKFRSTYATPLDYWHLAEEFSTLPVLDESFLTSAPPVARVVAVPSEPHFIFDSYFDVQTARPMPTYSVPGYIDHF